jgi:hypothetical protein
MEGWNVYGDEGSIGSGNVLGGRGGVEERAG